MSDWKSFLGLANRARKIISGEELVLKEVRSGKAKLVLLSEDASANTTKRIIDKTHVLQHTNEKSRKSTTIRACDWERRASRCSCFR